LTGPDMPLPSLPMTMAIEWSNGEAAPASDIAACSTPPPSKSKPFCYTRARRRLDPGRAINGGRQMPKDDKPKGMAGKRGAAPATKKKAAKKTAKKR